MTLKKKKKTKTEWLILNSRKAEIRKADFLTVGEACKVIF